MRAIKCEVRCRTGKGDTQVRGEFDLTRNKMPDGAAHGVSKRLSGKCSNQLVFNLCSHIGSKLRVIGFDTLTRLVSHFWHILKSPLFLQLSLWFLVNLLDGVKIVV